MSVALRTYLKPLEKYLVLDQVTEICINQPEYVFIERAGTFQCFSEPLLTENWLIMLAIVIAEFNHKSYPVPLIEGKLLNGERVQIVLNPACEVGKVIIAIRRHQAQSITLDDYEKYGAFDKLKRSAPIPQNDSQILISLYQKMKIKEFLKEAIKTQLPDIICYIASYLRVAPPLLTV